MPDEKTVDDMSQWGHTKDVSGRQKLIWSLLTKSWLQFAGAIPELSLDVGAAIKKGRSVSVDPFPRGEVDIRAVAENLPFRNGIFRSVVMESVIKHVHSPMHSLTGIHRILSEAGKLYLTSPINYRDHHRHSFTYSELDELLRKAGFRIERSVGFGFASNLLNRLLTRLAPRQYTRIRVPGHFCRVIFVVARRI